MEIRCDGCLKVYKIADDKFPASGTALVKCPSCGRKITVERGGEARSGRDFYENKEMPLGLEFFEPGARTAILYCQDPDAVDQLARSVKDLGFEVRQVAGEAELKARMRYHLYDLIVVYQKGHNPDEELLKIIDSINHIPIDERRRIFVVLIHFAGNRVDTLQAFSTGVDLTLNPLDIVRLEEILPYAMERRQLAYKTFFECLDRVVEEL